MERIAPGWKALGVGGAAVTVLAQTKPEEAISNIAAWAKLIGWEHMPSFLMTPRIDLIATVLGLGVLVLSLVMWRRQVVHVHHKELTSQSHVTISVGTVVHRAPQRDKTLHDGLFYASEGVWPVPAGGLALPSNYELYADILDELHQLARDGDITVWARPQRWQNSGIHEHIPCDQWSIGAVDLLDTFMEDCPMKRRENGHRIFVRLMISSAEFERQWPHD